MCSKVQATCSSITKRRSSSTWSSSICSPTLTQPPTTPKVPRQRRSDRIDRATLVPPPPRITQKGHTGLEEIGKCQGPEDLDSTSSPVSNRFRSALNAGNFVERIFRPSRDGGSP